MVRIVSIEALLNERRSQTGEITNTVPYVLNGKEGNVTKRIINGEMETLSFVQPIGEMIATPAGRTEMVQKVVLDVEMGRERVPLLYGPIYERIVDRDFPQIFKAKWAMQGVVVFLEHLEGEEITFGHLQAEQGPIAQLVTYAAGFEYTEDMVEYKHGFEMDMLNAAMGEAYNALLNHIHLYPIISYGYASGNRTDAVYVDVEGSPKENNTNAHPLLSLRETLKKGIGDALSKKRPGSVLLVSGNRLNHVQEAFRSMTVRGTDWPSLTGIDHVIAYDGWKVQVGKKSFDYDGVDDGKAFLIRPKRGFKELVKHDLIVDSAIADLSRLVESQIVGRTRRGVFAALTENVQEITLPSFS